MAHSAVQSPAPAGFSVDLISDIHNDYGEPYDYAAHKKNDIVIVDGDLADGPARALAELKKIAAIYKTVLFVDGNHEFRKSDRVYDYNFAAVETALRDGIAGMPNVTYLRDRPFVKDGVAIIGRNGHWDYKMDTGTTSRECIRQTAETFKTTFNNAASFSKMARRDYNALRAQVIALNQDPSIHTIVVVTHTVPRRELLVSLDIPSIWKSRAGAEVMRQLTKYDAHKKIKFWLFGHQHTPSPPQTIDGVFYLENPRGKSKDQREGYKPAVLAFPGKGR